MKTLNFESLTCSLTDSRPMCMLQPARTLKAKQHLRLIGLLARFPDSVPRTVEHTSETAACAATHVLSVHSHQQMHAITARRHTLALLGIARSCTLRHWYCKSVARLLHVCARSYRAIH